MNLSRKVWLQYSALGLIVSVVIVMLFDAFPIIRVLSNEGTVFGIMSASMAVAIDKVSKTSQKHKMNN